MLRKATLLALSATVAVAQTDLSSAAIATPANMNAPERKAVQMLVEEVAARTQGLRLGTGQSGHVAAVGYDLYCQMVTEVVAELKGEEVREPAEVKLDLPLDANLPKSYVEKEELRLEAYRRLAAVTTEAEVDDIRAEWEDRYGPVPDAAAALLGVARLRGEAGSIVPVHLRDPQRQAHSFFSLAVCGSSCTMP